VFHGSCPCGSVAASAAGPTRPHPDRGPKAPAPPDGAGSRGGCFWGYGGDLTRKLRGVKSRSKPATAGGSADTSPLSAEVSRRTTGHAEGIPQSPTTRPGELRRTAEVFSSRLAHGPHEAESPGPRCGRAVTARRSLRPIRCCKLARQYIEQLQPGGRLEKPIATVVESQRPLLPQAYHQDFVSAIHCHPYVVVHDLPKTGDVPKHVPELQRRKKTAILRHLDKSLFLIFQVS